jgi:hypothetical protein
MTSSPGADGRTEFGGDLEAALRRWGAFAEFPAGVAETDSVLRVLSSVLGDVISCYVLDSGRYVGVRLAAMPTVNAAHVAWGYVWVTPASLATAQDRGVDLRAKLAAAGLMVNDEVEQGLTVWNSQGLRDRSRSARETEPDRRLCPRCFLPWPGDTCPDCEVTLVSR